MRIRYPFAGAFAVLLLISAYGGLLPHATAGDGSKIPPSLQPNDKILHLVTFFLLSMAFYWIIDTSRRRTLHITVVACTFVLGIGSEIVQALLPNGRQFDPFDVLANIVGSLSAVGLCTWYHKRMLERRRKARFGSLMDGAGGEDVELGVTSEERERENGLGPQESGVTRERTLEEEVDNWDENAVDNWEEEGDEDNQAAGAGGEGGAARKPSNAGHEEPEDQKKRSD